MARDAGAKIISVVPSATETMNQKNINMSYEDILALSCDLMRRAKDDGIKVKLMFQWHLNVRLKGRYLKTVSWK